MLQLIPSKNVIESTGINFTLLSSIIDQFIKFDEDYTFKCVKHKHCFSEINLEKRIIRLFVSEKNNLQFYVGTIIHEIRHFMQFLRYKDILTFNYDNYKDYYYSPEERDARKFETIATDICKIYNAHISIAEKFKKNQFDLFKELDDNYKKQ
jgi:hypothetical protein